MEIKVKRQEKQTQVFAKRETKFGMFYLQIDEQWQSLFLGIDGHVHLSQLENGKNKAKIFLDMLNAEIQSIKNFDKDEAIRQLEEAKNHINEIVGE